MCSLGAVLLMCCTIEWLQKLQEVSEWTPSSSLLNWQVLLKETIWKNLAGIPVRVFWARSVGAMGMVTKKLPSGQGHGTHCTRSSCISCLCLPTMAALPSASIFFKSRAGGRSSALSRGKLSHPARWAMKITVELPHRLFCDRKKKWKQVVMWRLSLSLCRR